MKLHVLMLCLALYALPAGAQEFAIEQLDNSPRHHEWVEVPAENDRTVHSFVAYPETDAATPAVIVIHENRGLTDWVRSVADQVAAAGYVAIAPDLLSEFDAAHQRTRDFESSDAARDALYQLDPEQVISDLRAVQSYIAEVPSANGQTAVMGFCWGGAQTFRFASYTPDLSAALVFYGTAPEEEARFRNISAPVYGFYGEQDERVNATIPATEERMAQHDKTYEYEIYDGVGHAFMRQGDAPDASAADREARGAAWSRVQRILSDLQQ